MRTKLILLASKNHHPDPTDGFTAALDEEPRAKTRFNEPMERRSDPKTRMTLWAFTRWPTRVAGMLRRAVLRVDGNPSELRRWMAE